LFRVAGVEIPPESQVEEADEDELAFAEAVLKRQDGEETPVDCGYCGEWFPFRTCRLLLTEDYGGMFGSDERYIFVCENCWWELIGNPRKEALSSLMTSEELERGDSGGPGAGVDTYTLLADLKRREDAAGPGEPRSSEDA
jgi:hypothetical protein